MSQSSTLNVKLSNSQLNKLKSRIKNGSEAILKLSSNVVGASSDENNFLHKFLLINTQIWKFLKAFACGFSANMKLLKTHLHKIEQSRGFLGGILNSHF